MMARQPLSSALCLTTGLIPLSHCATVRDLHALPAPQGPGRRQALVGERHRVAAAELVNRQIARDCHAAIPFDEPERHVHAAEQVDAILHDGVENGLDVGRRPADDLQDLRGRRLLCQRFRQLDVARLELRGQAQILSGGCGLSVGGIFGRHAGNLPVSGHPE
jgi:hypothetical protein